MSELFDEEPRRPVPPRQSSGRAKALVITGAILVVTLLSLSTLATLYTDRLWYQSIGFGSVFSTMLWTRIGLFLVFGVLMGAVVGVNMWLAYRFRPLFGFGGGDASIERYRDAVTPIRTWLLLGVAGVVGLFAGSSAAGQWRNYLLWRHGESFGETDPYFGKDLGYYVFRLNWWHFMVDFAMTALILALIVTAIVHYLFGGIRLQAQHDRLSGAAQVQLSVLLGLFVLFKAVDYYLDRYNLVIDDNSLFTGMNFTGENALLPARNILIGVAAICAVLFFLNVWRRTWQLPSVGLALFVLSAILLGVIWPALVQQFQVNPSEADKERDYISVNIEATRAAYDIDRIDEQDYRGIPDGQGEIGALETQLTQVPLVDPQQVFQTFEQRQQPRVYYSVQDILDVDRYTFDGEDVPLVLGAREVDQSEIPDPNWTNLHTVYTHGEGIIAAYANRVSNNEQNGRMVWAEGIEDAENVFSDIPDFEPRIYYGEMSPDYSVVGRQEGGRDVELGLGLEDIEDPEDAEEAAATDNTTTYDGSGGVEVGSTFRQALYAIRFGEANFLLSGRVHENSKVLYNRNPVERVEAVAPWLTLDSDPYPAVVDGRVTWILDGYTTTDRYPNAQRESFETMIEDTLQQEVGFQPPPTDEINYIRSAVKATVDAYDGTVTLYAWDESDPVLQTWMNIFPDTVEPKSEISDALMEHIRYPEDLFKVQRHQYARYHVTNPATWYGGTDLWEVPQDPQSSASGTKQPPYRLFTRDVTSEDNGGTGWTLTSALVPNGRDNLSAYMQVNSDATSEGFGRIQALEMTQDNTPGPNITANEFQNDDGVRDRLRDFLVSDTPPIFGNVLTLPVTDGLIYIQPVYAVRSASDTAFPILQYVIVKYGENVGIGSNLAQALRESIGGNGDSDSGGEQQPPDGEGDGDGEGTPDPGEEPGNGGDGTLTERIDTALQASSDAWDAAEEAASEGDFVERERQLAIAEEQLQLALELIAERDSEATEDEAATEE